MRRLSIPAGARPDQGQDQLHQGLWRWRVGFSAANQDLIRSFKFVFTLSLHFYNILYKSTLLKLDFKKFWVSPHTGGCCMKSPTTVAACISWRGETTAPTWSGRRKTQTSSLFAGWQTTSKVLRSPATALQAQSHPLRKSELHCPVICKRVCGSVN